MHQNSSKNSITNPDAPTLLIIVMGVSGSGKSTLSAALAKHYGFVYVDADDFHNSDARDLMASGTPITDAHRAPWVSAIKQHLKDSATTNTHTVLSFSGLKQKHRNELRSAGLRTLFLFLNGDRETIQARLNNRTGHFMAPNLLADQLANLEDTNNEQDIFLLDILDSCDHIMHNAISIIDTILLKK
jgi:gluconokinase